MEIRRLNESFGVSDQITPADLPKITELGFKAVICNRPDGEGADQPAFETIAESAQRVGLDAAYVPVAPTGATVTDRLEFARQLQALPKPVLAYCRSGNRSTNLWQSLDPAERQAG
ncbi:MAG: TIGR01244 family phosphatase [Rhizobiales bacterium]|nr:TIGR01244 family phosphatase [Hyphomicrobiales bacterium]MBO6698794.1 TIGR01244 family phosphatase [Hyphomicrobiales bacterium]MBO6734953.1 TIGR01244 family phosphatase [Hyphomicrobiales bacterium]MBO6911241.1 TIGR01244 family phosphatase [Hyphomicrobiales bacterium]MBO6955755.1 TIGR01244 family phosphatase [Hyphomicrobiales bacterium]